MFALNEPFKGNGWASFPEHSGVTGDAIECPNCGAPYADIYGKVRVDGAKKQGIQPPVSVDASVADTLSDGDGYSEEAHNLDAKIRELYVSGMKPKEIADELGIGHYMVVVNRLKKIGVYRK